MGLLGESTTTAGLRNFAREHKSDAGYLDVAANTHGEEKGGLMLRALQRVEHAAPRVVEVGPGGGAAVGYLAAQLAGDPAAVQGVRLTLIEAPGVVSRSLETAMQQFSRVGDCELRHGFAQDIATLLPEPVDVISASALLHEVYSYGGGYAGLHTMMRTLPRVLTPGGFFAYRDVYAVDGLTLHQRVTQAYHSRAWLLFVRLFVPQYLAEGTHPYHRADDEIVVRQDSRIVPVAALDPDVGAVITAPVGLFRELQRHFITFRDHVWRSGVLGVVPELDGPLAADWIDFRAGHKRVHFRIDDRDAGWLPRPHRMMLPAVSEPYLDHRTIDSDIFDSVTDVALLAFLSAVESGESTCLPVWEQWLLREGRETYAYLTLDELLTAFVEHSAAAGTDTVLMPVCSGDVGRVSRHYYNRFLRQLPNPLRDAKQLVLLCNVPRGDVATAWEAVAERCSKPSLARMYRAITKGDN